MLNAFVQPYGRNLGIPNHTRELLLALLRRIDLRVIPIFPGIDKLEPEIQNKVGRYNKDWSNFMFWYPDKFAELPENGKPRTGYYIFETSILNKIFVEEINKLDMVLTASRWGINTLKSNGVTIPAFIVPGGINPVKFKNQRINRKNNRFTFLHVGKAEHRKSTDILIKAFNEAFKGSNNVRLLLSIDNPHLLEFNAKQFVKSLPLSYSVNNIEVASFVEDITSLYEEANIAVFPTRAEGIGLPIVESMAYGIPTIVSYNSGITEYANDQNAILLKDLKEEFVYDPYFFPEKDGRYGSWFTPSIDELIDKMLWAYSNYNDAIEIGEYSERWMRENFTWDLAADKFLSILKGDK